MLLTFGGSLYTAEAWSCSLRSTADFANSVQVNQTALDAVWPVVSAWVSGASSPLGNAAKLSWLKYNRVGTDGKYMSDVTFRKDFSPVVNGGQASVHAPQISLVATLETGAVRGLASRGRMFLPSPVFPMDATGRISAANAASAATAVAALITNLNNLPDYGVTKIYSEGGKVGAPTSRTVTGVTVGRVLDTMRSRRTSLLEERAAPATVGGT